MKFIRFALAGVLVCAVVSPAMGSVLMGDADGSGVVDFADAQQTLGAMLEPGITCVSPASAVTDDTQLQIKDLLYLSQYVQGVRSAADLAGPPAITSITTSSLAVQPPDTLVDLGIQLASLISGGCTDPAILNLDAEILSDGTLGADLVDDSLNVAPVIANPLLGLTLASDGSSNAALRLGTQPGSGDGEARVGRLAADGTDSLGAPRNRDQSAFSHEARLNDPLIYCKAFPILQNWTDISPTGLELPPGDGFGGTDSDNGFGYLQSGFDFRYFGTAYPWLAASINGLAIPSPIENDFTVLTHISTINQKAFPDTADPDRHLGLMYSDLSFHTVPGVSHLYHETTGTPPNRTLTVQWDDVYSKLDIESSSHLTFQLNYGEDGLIRYQYERLDGTPAQPNRPAYGGGSAVGIENGDGSLGVNWGPNDTAINKIYPNLSILFTPCNCNDGWLDMDEACDNPSDPNCLSDCSCVGGDCSALCGNGVLDAVGEECDDGNTIDDGNGCAGDCTINGPLVGFCGDGAVNAQGEWCDDGANNGAGEGFCATDCSHNQQCGDGLVGGSEACDDANTIDCDGCRADCMALETGCGDGFLCGVEVCDDANTSDCDGCRGDCSALETGCGDGFLCGVEVCDDANTADCDGCRGDCTALETGCGDGFQCGAEACDDGDTGVCGGPCNEACTDEYCGDGSVNCGEECDDSNQTDGDGCSSSCLFEPAPFPFYEPWESGAMAPYWTVTGSGDIDTIVTTANGPAAGSYHLTMDSATNGVYTINELTLRIDLSGASNVVISYMHLGNGDEPHPMSAAFSDTENSDGVAVSEDNFTWHRIDDLSAVGTEPYTLHEFDLDAVVSGAGLSYANPMFIRFQQYDNARWISSDGRAFDEIRVFTPVCGNGVTELGEACDDNNAIPCDGCAADCSRIDNICGDGLSECGEGCDDGDLDNCTIACDEFCIAPYFVDCGDGVQECSEVCDDGFGEGEGLCLDDCTGWQLCGDASTNGTEFCDDGYTDACGSCNATCTGPGAGSTCGDGSQCPETESCDDGFADACGSCNATCDGPGTGSTCGDISVCPETEACDDGPFASTLLDSKTYIGGAAGVTGIADRVYSLNNDTGLEVWDASSFPMISLGSMAASFGNDLAVYDGKAYLALGNIGFRKADVSNMPPTDEGTYDTPGSSWGVDVVGTKAYVADGFDVRVVNIGGAPSFANLYDSPGYAYDVRVFSDNIYIADWTNGLEIASLSPFPQALGNYDTPGEAYGVFIDEANLIAYVADGSAGVQRIDISTPSAPTLIDAYDTPGNANDVFVVGDRVYVADGALLLILDTSQSPMELAGQYDFGLRSAVDLWVYSGVAYVALQPGGAGSGALVALSISEEGDCRFDCSGFQACGDGITEGNEACDDTNTVGCDGCMADCTEIEPLTCGDGYLCGGEVCDDANNRDCDGCRNDCSAVETGCGDGFLCGAEVCDDTNTADCDGCRGDCSAVETGCGDGFLCGLEVCDDTNTADCDGCRGDCSAVETGCGDGFLCGAEVCDDTNTADCDGCRGDCSAVETGCGDGFLCGLEVCDDTNTADCDGCRGDCSAVETGCGDGFVCGLEVCDDSNTSNCDGCSGDCSIVEFGCGDGVVCGFETCDDFNNVNCDGCRGDCSALETGCGDGFVCGLEICDDDPFNGDWLYCDQLCSEYCEPQADFQAQYGDGSDNSVKGIVRDTEGNLYLFGNTSGFVDFGQGAHTGPYVAKFDPNGTCLVTVSFGSNVQIYSFAVDSAGNQWIAGTLSGGHDFGGGTITPGGGSSMFLVKYSPFWNHLYSEGFDASGFAIGPETMDIDGYGNAWITGTFNGTVDLGGGPMVSTGALDVFLLKLDPAGSHLFSNRYGASAGTLNWGYSLKVDSNNDIWFGGTCGAGIDFGGGALGAGDVFWAKMDNNGNHLYSNSTDAYQFQDIVIDSADNVWIAGLIGAASDFGGGPLSTFGGDDFYLAKFNSVGAHQFSNSYGGNSADSTVRIAVDQEDRLWLAAAVQSDIDLGGGVLPHGGQVLISDVALAGFDPNGVHLYSRRFYGDGGEGPAGIIIEPSGWLWITGTFQQDVDFGSVMNSVGGSDLFLLHVNPTGPGDCLYCGDGNLDPGETCDDGASNGFGSGWCYSDCSGVQP